MPSQTELLLEAERRGILPPAKQGLLDEARKRGIITDQPGIVNPPTPLPDAPPSTGFAQDVGRFFTGEGSREYDLPELGTSGEAVPAFIRGPSPFGEPPPSPFGEIPPSPFSAGKDQQIQFNPAATKMMGAYATSIDPKGIADIAVKTLPGASQWEDKHGNPIVTFEGKHYYVNDPGISEADLFQGLAQTGAFTPAAKIATGGATLIRQMVRMGVLSAATSVGADVAAGQLGSEQGVDLSRAAITGGIGFALQGLVPAAVAGWRGIFGKPKFFDEATGKLTKEGARAAHKAGLDPADMTRRLAKAFAEEIIDEPTPALAATRAYTKAYDIPYTRGQQLANAGVLGQVSREQAMRHGASGFGEVGQVGMRQAGEAAERASERVIGGVQKKLAGPRAKIAGEYEAGDVIRRGVVDTAQKLDDAINAAYTEFRGTPASMQSRKPFKDLLRTTARALDDFDLDAQLYPATLKNVGLVLKEAKSIKAPPTFRQLEVMRRKMQTNARAGGNPSDQKAARKIIRVVDDWEDELIEKALIEGDDAALDIVRKARRLRTEKRTKFGVSDKWDDAGKIIETMVHKDLNPTEVVNMIFGVGQVGKKGVSSRVVPRLKEIFGEDSPQWNAVREAAWMRLTQGTKGNMKTPKQFQSAWDEAWNKNKGVLEAMFTPDELLLMRTVRKGMMLRIVPEEAKNPSKTAYSLMRALRDMIRRGGTKATFSGHHFAGGGLFLLGRQLPMIGKGGQQRAVSEALEQLRPIPKAPVFPAAGAAIGNTLMEQ